MILLALLACSEPAPVGLPDTWLAPLAEGAWLYATPDATPVPLESIPLGTAGQARFPRWLPADPLPSGRMLATLSPDAALVPVVDADEVYLDGLTWDAWSWIGHDPTTRETLVPVPAFEHDGARLWLDPPPGTYALVEGDHAFLARLLARG